MVPVRNSCHIDSSNNFSTKDSSKSNAAKGPIKARARFTIDNRSIVVASIARFTKSLFISDFLDYWLYYYQHHQCFYIFSLVQPWDTIELGDTLGDSLGSNLGEELRVDCVGEDVVSAVGGQQELRDDCLGVDVVGAVG